MSPLSPVNVLIKTVKFCLFVPALYVHIGSCNSSSTYAPARARGNEKTIYLKNVHDFIISNKSIAGGYAACITLVNCYNVRISHNKFYNSTGVGIKLINCGGIQADHNYFNKLSTGVYAERCAGGSIRVNHNQFLNMQGPYPRGQFVQFNQVSGPANSISFNRCENLPGKSNPEDGISLYKCNGTQSSPIVVKGNWLRGGGPSTSGGGIMLGDNGGSYQIAADNILVDPGQYGIAISGGSHNSIVGNSIYARAQHFTNVGLYVAGFDGTPCANITVTGNKVRYYNKNKSLNNSWLGQGAAIPAGWAGNDWSAKIDARLLPAVIITFN